MFEYINCHKDFTVTDMRHDLDEAERKSVWTYINYIHQAGFIERKGKGYFWRKSKIPMNLSMTDVKNIAYKTKNLTQILRKYKLEEIDDRNDTDAGL